MTNSGLKTIKVIVGLGNPGSEYKETYHNAGQLFVEYLMGGKTPAKANRFFSYLPVDLVEGKIFLVKPYVYMNESGSAVLSAMARFKTPSSKILIAHDDSDLALGSYKLSDGRGAAGHKGILSIFKAAGTGFPRLRIGIRKKLPREAGRVKAGDFVLKKITAEDKKELYRLFEGLKETVIENEARP